MTKAQIVPMLSINVHKYPSTASSGVVKMISALCPTDERILDERILDYKYFTMAQKRDQTTQTAIFSSPQASSGPPKSP